MSDKQKQATKDLTRQEINRVQAMPKTYYAGILCSTPFLFIVNRLVRDRVGEGVGWIILALTVLVVTYVFSVLVRRWLYKKPYSSKWYIFLD